MIVVVEVAQIVLLVSVVEFVRSAAVAITMGKWMALRLALIVVAIVQRVYVTIMVSMTTAKMVLIAVVLIVHRAVVVMVYKTVVRRVSIVAVLIVQRVHRCMMMVALLVVTIMA